MPEVRVTRQVTDEWVLPNLPDMDEQQSKAAYRAMSPQDLNIEIFNQGVSVDGAHSDDVRVWVYSD